MKEGTNFLFVILLSVLASCSIKKQVNPEELISYVEGNESDYKRKIVSGEMEYTFQFKPIDYIVCKEMQQMKIDVVLFKKREKELHHSVWFNVAIAHKRGKTNPLKRVNNIDEYNARYKYFLTEASNSFKLLYGDKGEMKRVAYHFENNYGLTPMDVIVIGYSIPDSIAKEDITLVYNDEFYNGGPIKVKITSKEISNKPYLVFQ